MAAAFGLTCVSCRSGSLRGQCEDALKKQQNDVAIVACGASYKQSLAQRDLFLFARATLRGGNYEDARPLFEAVKDEAYLGDAELGLAYCDLGDGNRDSQLARLQRAITLFEKYSNFEGQLSALISLAQSHLEAGALDAAVDEASRAFAIVHTDSALEPNTTSRAFLTIIDVYSRIQDYEAAHVVLEEARQRDWSASSQDWLTHRQATYYEEHDEPSRAKQLLEESIRKPAGDRRLRLQQKRSLAWLEYLTEEYDKARTSLDELREENKDEPFDSLLLRAFIAGANEDWEAAQRFLDAAEAGGIPDEDYRWALERTRAELAEQTGQLSIAQRSYEQTIRHISVARVSAPKVDAFFLAGQRAPYEALIALHAEHGDWREALKVVLLLDADNLLRSTGKALHGAKVIYGEKDKISVPIGHDPFAAAEAIVDEVISRWSDQGTLSIVVAPEARKLGPVSDRQRDAYRIVVRDKTVTGERLGKADQLVATFESASKPADVEGAGKFLAKKFLPDDGDSSRFVSASGWGGVFAEMGRGSRFSNSRVAVLAIGRLGKVPLTWLLDDAGNLVMGRRSLSRAFALREETQAPADNGLNVVIAADPRPEKKLAFLEKDAEMAVRKLQETRSPENIRRFGLGTAMPATRERLWEAKRARVFYLAAHVTTTDRRRTILLDTADGLGADAVPAGDLKAAGFAPRLAVFANCGSAAAQDDAAWGSIAVAASKAGSLTVVATLTDVDDAQTHALMEALMSQPDWETDTALALGRVLQKAKDGKINGVAIKEAEWRSFMVITRAPFVSNPQTASLQKQP